MLDQFLTGYRFQLNIHYYGRFDVKHELHSGRIQIAATKKTSTVSDYSCRNRNKVEHH